MKRFKKISKRTLKIILHLVELCLAFVGVILGLILYQLHISPMDGRFLLPELEKYVLPKDSGYRIQAESVIVSSDWQKPGLVQIEIQDMNLLRPDNTLAVSLPKALLAYDFWDVITFDYVPSMIRLKSPSVNMLISDKGVQVNASKSDKPSAPMDLKKVDRIVRHFLSFRRMDILDADLTIQDLRQNKTLQILDGKLTFHRRFHFMEKIRLSAQVKSPNLDTNLILHADLNRLTKQLSFQAGIPEIDLSSLGHLLPVLSGVKFPTQISVKGDLDLEGIGFVPDMVEKVQFNITALEKGTLNLPEPLTNLYPIQSLMINGIIGQGMHNIKIGLSEIVLDYGTHATLDVSVSGMREFLSSGDLSNLKTTLKSTVSNVPTEKIGAVWPKGVGTSSHEWVSESLTKGKIQTADFRLDFQGDELVDLYGDILAEGISVDYLSPMPKVTDVTARVYLYPDKVHIQTQSGRVGDLKLLKGDILLTDVDIDPSWAKIKLTIDGPVNQALQLLDSPPLEFPKDYGIISEKASGTAQIETDLFFRLDTDIEPKDVQVSTKATLKNAGLVLLDEKLNFSNGNMTLTVKDNILDLHGTADLFKIPLHLKWQEYFFPTNGVRSHYDVSVNVSSTDLAKVYPNITNWINGNVSLHLTATQQDKTDQFLGQLLADATDADLHSFLLNSTKEKGIPLSMDLRFDILPDSGKIHLDLLGKSDEKMRENLFLLANMSWGKELLISLEKVKMGQNDFALHFKKTDKDLSLILKGQAMDLSDLFNTPDTLKLSDESGSDFVSDIDVDVYLDKIILNKQKPIQNFIVKGKRLSNLWQNFHAQADLKEPFILVYDSQRNQFQGAYPDFGDMMDYLGLSDRFDGGKMSLVADQKDNGHLKTKLSISKIQFKKPGFLIQALTILGIVDAFMGKDMVFDKMEIPLTLFPSFDIKIGEAYAAGTSLGITFTGKIKSGLLNLSGAVIPAYGINSLPGKIPVVGYLFRNSTGGGLISVPYSVSGTLSKPETAFHPLGTITPGALGRLF